MAVKAAAGIGMGYGRIPLEPFVHMTGSITRAATLVFALLLIVLALRRVVYRGKSIGRAGTWGCGFTRPTAKMQYTEASYAASILEFFRPVAPLREDHPAIRGRFPLPTHYRSTVHDLAETHLDGIAVKPVLFLFDKLRWIQHGDIHLYIGYILLAIVVLLFFV
jgi:hydrogenase-4 component B